MKKIFSILLTLTLVLALLSACGGAPAATDAPAGHAPQSEAPQADAPQNDAPQGEVSDAWQVDPENHWHVTADGHSVDVAAHDDSPCSVCRAEVVNFEDGESWVQIYNDHGDCTLWMIFMGNEILDDTRSEFTYDDEGRWATKKEYQFGRLTTEVEYQTNVYEDGWDTSEKINITYHEDGSKTEVEYDAHGWICSEAYFDADGKGVYDHTYINEFDENGLISVITKFEGGAEVSRTVYEHDADGEYAVVRVYEGEKLVREDFYTRADVDDFAYSYCSKSVFYNEDGTIVVEEYDEFGELISELLA